MRRGSGPEEISHALGTVWLEEPTATAAASNIAACVERANSIRRRGKETAVGDSDGEHRSGAAVVLNEAFLSEVPLRPGVYRFFDGEDRLVYVGKAANLRRRLASYAAAARAGEGSGVRRVIRELSAVERVEYEETGTEVGALLREAELIARRSPRGNVQRRVDERGRSYAPGRRRILLLPIGNRGAVAAVFLRSGTFEGWCRIGPRGGGLQQAATLIQRLLSHSSGTVARRKPATWCGSACY